VQQDVVVFDFVVAVADRLNLEFTVGLEGRTPFPWIVVVCSLSLSSGFQYTLASPSELQMVRNTACCSSSSTSVFGGEPVRTAPAPMDSKPPMRLKSIS
jgi:hypothetical protein